MNFLLNVFITLVVISIFGGNVKGDDTEQYKTVKTSNGPVRGILQTTLLNKSEYYGFKGIPYAKSPTGDLRFKAPEPADPWNELDAFTFGKSCMQPSLIGVVNATDEDCLFLNVYVPADVQPCTLFACEKLPVLVYIHGGGFADGSGNDDFFGPDFLLEKRVIVVTMNYRLGIFGFLSLNSSEYSGNMALKDQQLAIKWTYTNIKQFSGDNKRITIFGESAGSAMTHFQVLSSESRKYFRSAIHLSGTALNYWAIAGVKNHLSLAYQIAENLGEPQQSDNDLVEFLKSASADSLVPYGGTEQLYRRTLIPIFAPIIENKDAVRVFITEDPSQIYEESAINVDAMFSFCSREYMSFYASIFTEIYNVSGLGANFTLTLPFRGINLTFDSSAYKKIADELRTFYFQNQTIDETTLKQYLDLLSHLNYAYHTDKAAKQHDSKSPSNVYYYRFSIDSKLNALKQTHQFDGAGHADDLCYIFRCNAFQPAYDEILATPDNAGSQISLKAIDNVSKLLTNFAKYGSPTVENDPVSGFNPIRGNRAYFLDVTNNGLVPGVNPNQEAYKLWAQIENEAIKASGNSTQTHTHNPIIINKLIGFLFDRNRF